MKDTLMGHPEALKKILGDLDAKPNRSLFKPIGEFGGIRVIEAPFLRPDQAFLVDSGMFRYKPRPIILERGMKMARILPDGFWLRLKCRLKWWWEDIVAAWRSLPGEIERLLDA